MPRDNHLANGRKLSVPLGRILLTLSAVTTAILFAWLLYYSTYGVDLADEGLSLDSVANPFTNRINIPPSLFSLMYHWRYHWAGGDIVAPQVANVTPTIALGWVLSFLVIQRLWTVKTVRATALAEQSYRAARRQRRHSQKRSQW